MNWLLVGLPLAVGYLIWFGYLLIKKKYNKATLFFALAHIPYLLVNLVAPFRGLLDPDYAGYSFGLIVLPNGPIVTLVVGIIVIFSLLLASRALMGKMKGWWLVAFVFDLLLCVLVAIPISYDMLTHLSDFRIELGEYLTIKGIWTALIIFFLFTFPTIFACLYAGKQALSHLNAARKTE